MVNFAAESHVDRSITGGAEFMVANVVGAQTIFDVARKAEIGNFLHISTDEVYGSVEEPDSFREGDGLEPNSPYSVSKAAADLLARAYNVTYDYPVTVTRTANNFGPYHYPEKVIPLFVSNLLDGRKVPLYGDGFNVRDWLHVDDHCRGIQLVAEKGRDGEIYNIGGGTELTNRDLTHRLLAAVGAGAEMIEPVADRLGHDRRYSVDWRKIADELGYAPQVSFDRGLADTVAWYAANRAWWEPLKAR